MDSHSQMLYVVNAEEVLTAHRMTAEISDVFFVKRRCTLSSETLKDDTNQVQEPKLAVTTMADSLSPLLTSMKVFGLYFKRETHAGVDKSADEKSRRRWNASMIHSLLVAVAMWINVARMFSVFQKTGL